MGTHVTALLEGREPYDIYTWAVELFESRDHLAAIEALEHLLDRAPDSESVPPGNCSRAPTSTPPSWARRQSPRGTCSPRIPTTGMPLSSCIARWSGPGARRRLPATSGWPRPSA